MREIKILLFIGTRPEAIKMAPLVSELRSGKWPVHVTVCSTGQHREMLDQVLSLFEIRPDVELSIMTPKQSLSGVTAALFRSIDEVVAERTPDWVLAQGDTTTAMVAGMVAFYRRVPFGHVEAGLRTYDRHRPFPEEINRRIADLLADLYFAPTKEACDNLLRENVPGSDIIVSGNTVIDALLHVAAQHFDWSNSALRDLPSDKRIILVTAHRRESFGAPFRGILNAIRELAGRFQDYEFVYPVHLNPNVREPASEVLGNIPNVHLIAPLEYDAMVHLMKASYLIMTDSGGIQEEAPSLGVPVLVLRDATERPEGVHAGVVKLVGTDCDRIVNEVTALLNSRSAYKKMANAVNPFGDGKASERIASAIVKRYQATDA